MPIPDFDRYGLLPFGIHDCSMAEIDARFGWNEHRHHLVELLGKFLQHEIRPRFAQPFHVDGSFVTDKHVPNDVDVSLDMRTAHEQDMLQALMLMVRHKKQFRQQYKVDFWVSFPAQNDFSDFFQYVGTKTARFKGLHPRHRKGILSVV